MTIWLTWWCWRSARTSGNGCCAGTRERFPEAYKEDFAAGTAVHDLSRLEALDDDDGLSFEAYTPPSDDEADRRLKVFRTGDPLSLAGALPIFSQMNIEVLDERPYEIERSDGSVAWIYDFGLRLPAGRDLDARAPRRSSTPFVCSGTTRSSRTASTPWSWSPV